MSTDYVRVLAWPIADPKQRVHLAPADEWRVVGATLCGSAIKVDADHANATGEDCERCARRAARQS